MDDFCHEAVTLGIGLDVCCAAFASAAKSKALTDDYLAWRKLTANEVEEGFGRLRRKLLIEGDDDDIGDSTFSDSSKLCGRQGDTGYRLIGPQDRDWVRFEGDDDWPDAQLLRSGCYPLQQPLVSPMNAVEIPNSDDRRSVAHSSESLDHVERHLAQ